MAELARDELEQLYTGVVQKAGHPDPLGYMARAIMMSGGNPDYIDVEGKAGFMPVKPELAQSAVGAVDVHSLMGNVVATLAMDRLYFQQRGTIEGMVTMFHSGATALRPNKDTKEMLAELPAAREDIYNMIFPRKATVDDVITLLTPGKEHRLSKDEKEFFTFLQSAK